jgi:hypothetical protein
MNESETKTYKISIETRIFEIVALLFLSVALISDSSFITHGRIVTSILLLIFLWNFIFEVYCIEIEPKGTVKFNRLIRSFSIDVGQIVSFSKGYRFERIKFKDGKITLSPFFSNVPKLKAALRELNPNIISEDEAENPKKVSLTIVTILLIFVVSWAFLIMRLVFDW